MRLYAAVVLVLVGVIGLSVAAWMVYPPLGIAVPSAACLYAGLRLDVEGG